MRRVSVGIAVICVVAGFLAAGATRASASGDWRDTLSNSKVLVVPYYNVGAGFASFLVLHNPTGEDRDVLMNFYDASCDKQADFFDTLTPTDTNIYDLAVDIPVGVPAEGAIFVSADEFAGEFSRRDRGIFGDIVNVDVLNGTVTVLNAIPTTGQLFPITNAIAFSADWFLYDSQAVVTFGPKDDGSTATVFVTLSCPQGDLAAAMLDWGGEVGRPLTFTEHGGTVEYFVFDLDENFLGSIHGVDCDCFERKRLSAWTAVAATEDVVIYFQEQGGAANAATMAGFLEVTVAVGSAKFHASTYLHHADTFIGGL